MRTPFEPEARFGLMIVAASFLSAACFGSGYEFEGIGAREVSRGGAAIADSPDWTAIYWNPANLRKAAEGGKSNFGIELFGGSANAHDGNSLSSLPTGAAFTKDDLSSDFLLGAVGGVIPLGERAALGFGFYTPLLQGVDFSDDAALIPGTHLDYKASAGILTWALEAAVEVVPGFYAGAGLDLLYGKLDSDSRLSNFPLPGNDSRGEMKGDGMAIEGIFGLRWEVSEEAAFGAVYRTGADVSIRGPATVTNSVLPNEKTDFRYDLRHPPTAGVGVSIRPVDRWTFNIDFTQTYWTRFSSAIDFDRNGLFLVDSPNTLHWRDAWKLRLGTAFKLSDKSELLAGYSHDRPAIDPGSVDFATTVDVPMNRVYLGASRRWTERWESIIGGVYGRGERVEQGVEYRLSGWQLMFELQLHV